MAQVLTASTDPLEIVQLQQWLARNENLNDKELADAVAKQPSDPSVQALAGPPEAVRDGYLIGRRHDDGHFLGPVVGDAAGAATTFEVEADLVWRRTPRRST